MDDSMYCKVYGNVNAQIENCIIVVMERERELETRSIICCSFKFDHSIDRLPSNK
jgi:hypothetical protein